MNLNEFNSFVNKSEKTIAIDFDGVIHNDSLGFHDGTIYGDPIDGSLIAIKELSKNYKLIIYTCKANPKRPLIESKNGIDLIWKWLDQHKITNYIDDVIWGKPNAIIYIDDKGYRFQNWHQTIKDLNIILTNE
tara:strand:- start:888 stop:1286 length:399 start_codon:yes stop_codon:yes gene_type:complete